MSQSKTIPLKWIIATGIPIISACLGWAVRAEVAQSRLSEQVQNIQSEQDRRRPTVESIGVINSQLGDIKTTTDKSAEHISEIKAKQAQMQADIVWIKQKLNK